MAVSDYLGSAKCNLHKFPKPAPIRRADKPRRDFAPLIRNLSAPVDPRKRRADIDALLSGNAIIGADYFDWCRQSGFFEIRLSRRLARRFFKSKARRSARCEEKSSV